MKTVIITGSSGLIGSECARFYANREWRVVGIDGNQRAKFFGADASTIPVRRQIEAAFPENYFHYSCDIRESDALDSIFATFWPIDAVIHTAAQPSHDWAAREPLTDWGINATGTLNLLEATRKYCPKAAFIFTSTNKVYGDKPNSMVYRSNAYCELESRFDAACFDYETEWWADETHGFSEEMPIDQSKHSLFGCSKLAADILVQEYGRYFGMNTVAFRCGCLTGPAQCGAQLHGFLSYLVRCAVTGTPYTVIGYKGKQVRDNLHSFDLVNAFDQYIRNPRPGEVYNMGGGEQNSCSVREAIVLVERIAGRKLAIDYCDDPRSGDHQWWISDTRKFRRDYPEWSVSKDLEQIITEIVSAWGEREIGEGRRKPGLRDVPDPEGK